LSVEAPPSSPKANVADEPPLSPAVLHKIKARLPTGQYVHWTTHDADIPRGAIGRVREVTATGWVRVDFSGTVFRFRPWEVLKVVEEAKEEEEELPKVVGRLGLPLASEDADLVVGPDGKRALCSAVMEWVRTTFVEDGFLTTKVVDIARQYRFFTVVLVFEVTIADKGANPRLLANQMRYVDLSSSRDGLLKKIYDALVKQASICPKMHSALPDSSFTPSGGSMKTQDEDRPLMTRRPSLPPALPPPPVSHQANRRSSTPTDFACGGAARGVRMARLSRQQDQFVPPLRQVHGVPVVHSQGLPRRTRERSVSRLAWGSDYYNRVAPVGTIAQRKTLHRKRGRAARKIQRAWRAVLAARRAAREEAEQEEAEEAEALKKLKASFRAPPRLSKCDSAPMHWKDDASTDCGESRFTTPRGGNSVMMSGSATPVRMEGGLMVQV